jgi:hypothetical protein
MPKGVAVFDLDGTLGDLSSIDYFSNIYDIDTILRSTGISQKNKDLLKKNYNSYSKEIKEFLLELRDTYEKKLTKYGFTQLILRDDIEKIMNPIVSAIDDRSLAGCIIYSNNGNPYTLEFVGRAIERYYERKDIFFAYLDRANPLRDEFDGGLSGARKKTFNTIKKVTKEIRNISEIQPSDVIFFDDLIHPDLKEKKVHYVHVKQFHSIIHKYKLEEMFSLFEDTLYELFMKYKTIGGQFFDLYHIKNIIGLSSIEQMEEHYLQYSREDYHPTFISDYPDFKDKIDTYIDSIKKYASHTGGRKRKSSTKKRLKHSNKKNRTRY